MFFGFKVKKGKGCLYGKTPAEKKSFFQSLAKFATTDKQFFEEQFRDLRPNEQKEFADWVLEDTAQKKQLLALVGLVGKLLDEKHKSKT